MINITILKTDTTQVNITVSKQGLLQTLQGIVGGYIQVLGLDRKTIMIVNEEGLLKKLPLNFKASKVFGQILLGDVVIMNNKDFK